MKTTVLILGYLFGLAIGVVLGANIQYAFGVVKMVLRHCGGA